VLYTLSVPIRLLISSILGGVYVRAGDMIMIDYVEGGVVAIPRKAVDDVIDMLPKLVEADEKVMKDVLEGGEVGAAFKKWRS
jgi:regulator of RNase E activity RraA